VNPHVSVGAYHGYAAGKLVIQSIYPNGMNANFGYLELTFRMCRAIGFRGAGIFRLQSMFLPRRRSASQAW